MAIKAKTTVTLVRVNDGATGKGVKSSAVTYQASTSGTTIPTGTWSSSIPSVTAGSFLWTRTIITYTDNATTTSYSVGKMGNTGATGATGPSGKGIKSTAITYQAGSSGTSAPSGTWSSSIPATSASAPYLWSRTIITYTDNTTSTTYSVGSTPEGVVVGGRNLWRNTGLRGSSYWNGWYQQTVTSHTDEIIDDSTTSSGKARKITYTSAGAHGPYTNGYLPAMATLKAGKTYTQSVKMKASSNISVNWGHEGLYSSTVTVTTAWKTFTKVITIGSSDVNGNRACHFYPLSVLPAGTKLYIADYKFEEGNKATDWTPAPEDVDAAINSKIASVDVEYYLSTSSTALSGGSWQTTAPAWVNGKYMWSRTKKVNGAGVVTYSPSANGTCIAGATGATGAAGKGVKSIVEQYYQSTSATAQSGGSWSTTVPTWVDGKYIWTRSVITYTDNSTTTTTAVCVTGQKGNTGSTGPQGPAGKGIKSTAITYQAGTSGTTAPSGTWVSAVPSVSQGQYLWSRTIITYTDNTTSTTYSVAYIPTNGQNGATGATGATGTGVQSITQQYYLSTSKTTQSGGSWVNTMPTWSSGKYLWTRYAITYKNPTSTAYTSPICDSSWEAVNEVQVGGRNYIVNGKGTVKDGIFTYFNTVDGGYAEHTLTSKKTYSNVNLEPGFVLGCRDYTVGQPMMFSYDIMYTEWNFPSGTDRREWWFGQRYTNQPIEGGSTSGQWRGVTYHNLPVVGVNGCVLNEWFHVEKSIIIPEQAAEGIGTAASIQFYNSNADVEASVTFRLKNVKLEYGTKATDWTPSFEEIATNDDLNEAVENIGEQISASEAVIETLTDSISMLVTDSDGTSMMSQTGNGWTFNIGDIMSKLSTVGNALNDMSEEHSATNDALNKLTNLANDLAKKTAYITMTTDAGGNPCIELGKEGNPFKVRITNTAMDFLENGLVIATANNNSFSATKMIVKSDLQIGEVNGIIWKIRPNGNIGLIYTS